MLKSEIEVGGEYGLREPRSAHAPLQHVRILAHVRRNKWKAQWVDPNPGLIDYVESRQLVVRWKDRKALLRDEERERAVREHDERHGGRTPTPLTIAVEEVFEAASDDLIFLNGVVMGHPDAVTRVRDRARVDLSKQSPFSYVDRLEPYISRLMKPSSWPRRFVPPNRVRSSRISVRSASGAWRPDSQAGSTS